MLLFLRCFCVIILFISCNDYKYHTKPSVSGTKKLTIGILPYKGFDTTLFSFVQREVEQFYQCKTTILPAVQLPKKAYYEPRGRYKADSLLDFQTNFLNDSIDVVIGLTDKDISTSHGSVADWGIFGLGYLPGRACVISTKRLTATTSEQFKERLVKVILHEMGHNLGLPHCANHPECMMNNAKGQMATVDREKKWLCANCKTKISE